MIQKDHPVSITSFGFATIINITKIMKNILNLFKYLIGYFALFYYFTMNLATNISLLNKAPIRSVLYKQIYFTGIEALSKVAAIGILIGIVIITQIANLVGTTAVLTGKILIWVVVRELGPLFAAIIIIARSGTAVSSELASMKHNMEFDSLRIMGINPIDYLIFPRIIGITISVFILSFYFQTMAIAGALAFTSLFLDLSFLQHLNSILLALKLHDIFVSMFKSLTFGFLIAIVSCYQGLNVKKSITEIPQTVTRAVMQSLSLVFFFDVIITVIVFI